MDIQQKLNESINFYWRWAQEKSSDYDQFRINWLQVVDILKGISQGITYFSNLSREEAREFADYCNLLNQIAWYHISHNPFD